MLRASTAAATLGGIALVTISAVTVYSVVGRALPEWPWLTWWRPVRGDFELVEMGTAFAIFSFLPYAQLTRANVLVDVFTSGASPRAKSAMAVPANLLLTGIAALFTWRMAVATEALMTSTYTQTTMMLRMPTWWGYLPATVFMAFLALVSGFTVWRALDEALHDGERPASHP
jgi:TRAP-type C4-dicarboxylate transport system permease small subunit